MVYSNSYSVVVKIKWVDTTKIEPRDSPGGAVVKNLPDNTGDTGSSPGPGRSHMPRNN